MSTSNKTSDSWVHYSAPKYGIQDVLFPEGHGVIEIRADRITGGYDGTGGRFEINILHSAAQVTRQLEALQEITSDPDNVRDPLTYTDFGVDVSDDISSACSVCFDSGDEYSQSEYRVVLKSPFGHGLYIIYTVPSKELDFAKGFAKKMLASLKWTDRSALFKNASSRVDGTWQLEYEVPEAAIWKPDHKTTAKENLMFDQEGSFTSTKVLTHVSGSGEEEAEVAGFGAGTYEAYEDADGFVYLVTMDSMSGMDETYRVEIKDGKMIRDGKEWVFVPQEPSEF